MDKDVEYTLDQPELCLGMFYKLSLEKFEDTGQMDKQLSTKHCIEK